MTEELEAAQEQSFVIEGEESPEQNEVQTPESAPEGDTTEPEEKTNGVQERINKITADKYAEKRRADDLEKRLKELEAKQQPELKEPSAGDFETDEEYTDALIDYRAELKVQDKLQQREESAKQTAEQSKADGIKQTFDQQVAKLEKTDFVEKANAIPVLPPGVAVAIMSLDNGAEMVYHLGENLDVADSLASMSPESAFMELGRISASMNVKPETKTSAAPDPIEPLSSGSAIAQERGPDGATFE